MKTPQESYAQLNQATGIEVYLKREDLHTYGSHKGRSIPHMIEHYYKHENKHSFVISSSGNAALAAIKYIVAHNKNTTTEPIQLQVFIGSHIAPEKKEILEIEKRGSEHIIITQTEKPKQSAFAAEKEGNAVNLRQSTDDQSLIGYHELAHELARIPRLCAIFIPTSSGTTAEALAEAFEQSGEIQPQIHIVQTEAIHPIAEVFDTEFSESSSSLAGAIVDKIAHRKEKVVKAITKTGGFGWVVNNTEIQDAINLVKDACDISISTNSALSVAGLEKALKKDWEFDGAVVCLITGM